MAQSLADPSIRLDSPEAEKLRLDSIWENPGPWKQQPPPVWPGLRHDLWIQNGQLRSFSLTDPDRDLTLEVGQLGVAPRGSLLAPSGYFNARKGWEWRGRLDTTLKLQAGVIDLKARLFYDDNPALDRRVDALIQDAKSIGRDMGVADDKLAAFGDYFQYSKDYESATMLVGSALLQHGKTWNFGPIDAGFVAGELARFAYRFPNLTADQTLGLRMRAGPDVSIGLFYGLTEAVGFVNRNVWRDTLAKNDFEHDIHVEGAPHVSAEVWGQAPRSGLQFTAGGGYQLKPMSHRGEVHGGLLQPIGSGGIYASGNYEVESGPEIEFYRRKAGVELGLRTSRDLEIFAGYSNEKIDYGGVGVDNQAFLVGLRGQDGSGPIAQAAQIERVFGGKDDFLLPKSESYALLEQTRGLAGFLDGMWSFVGEGGSEKGWISLRKSWDAIDPELRDLINKELQEHDPNIPSLDLIFLLDYNKFPADLKEKLLAQLKKGVKQVWDTLGTGYDLSQVPIEKILKVLVRLTDPAVYERVLIRFARHKLLETIAERKVPVLGQRIYLTPPKIIAMAHVYSLGLSPAPPITQKDARESLDPYLIDKAKSITGLCGENAASKEFTDCLIDQLPADEAERLRRLYGDKLPELFREAVAWHSNVIRREINRALLEVFLASEALNALTVDRGIHIGDLNKRWLIKSFSRMDKAQHESLKKIIARARSHVEEELKKQEEWLRLRLKAYGQARLDQLGSAGIEADQEDMAPLLAWYGDGLFDFLEKARTRVPTKLRLRLEYNPDPVTGVVIMTSEGVLTVKLPPVEKTTTPPKVLDMALKNLD